MKSVCIEGMTLERKYHGNYQVDETLILMVHIVSTVNTQFCRYAFQIVLQIREMLQALPSLVDIDVPNGKHFTVCGDVHGQVISSSAV